MNGIYICIALIALANIMQIIYAEKDRMQIYKMIIETNQMLLQVGMEVKKIKEELTDD